MDAEAGHPTVSHELTGLEAPEIPPPLEWPPPGLEPLHARTGALTARAALASLILVLPLLFWVTREQTPAVLLDSPRPVLLLGFLGSVALAIMAGTLLQQLRAAAGALRLGFGALTVVESWADRERDAGSLISGTGRYAGLGSGVRASLRGLRLGRGALSAAAALWPVAGFLVGLPLAARGALGAGSLRWLVFAPTLVAAAAGALGAAAIPLVYRAARESAPAAAGEPRLDERARAWRQAFEQVRAGQWLGQGPGIPAALARAATLTVGLAFVFLLALSLLLYLPGLIAAAAWQWRPERMLRTDVQRTIEARLLAQYRLARDPTITAEAAGRAIHNLVRLDDVQPASPLYRPPATTYARLELPATGGPLGLQPMAWPRELMGRARAGLTPEQREYLRTLAQHPARADFSLLARASAADVIGQRFRLPFPPGTPAYSLPAPRYLQLRAVTQAQLAAAALDLEAGRSDRAETALREVLSAGMLIRDEATTALEGWVGMSLARDGAQALLQLYRASGRERDAERIATALQAGRLAEDLQRAGDDAQDPFGFAALAADSVLSRGVRWDLAAWHAPDRRCSTPHHMVFGPGPAGRESWRRIEEALVRRPAEAEYLRLLEDPLGNRPGSPLRLLLRQTLGRQADARACPFIGAPLSALF